MGNTVPNTVPTAQHAQSHIHVYLQDLPQMVHGQVVSTGKFLKTVVCRSVEQGECVVKVYRSPKAPSGSGPNPGDPALKPVAARLSLLKRLFSLGEEPNVLPYQGFSESRSHAVAFLLRQHFASTLADTLNTHPFPTDVEKRWFAYQLLCALDQAHRKGVIHGDVKAENLMVTSWNWVLLTDFASFKPPFLPAEDDPAVFYYFFEPGNRRRCYIAPERFKSKRGEGDAGAASPPTAAAAPRRATVSALPTITTPSPAAAANRFLRAASAATASPAALDDALSGAGPPSPLRPSWRPGRVTDRRLSHHFDSPAAEGSPASRRESPLTQIRGVPVHPCDPSLTEAMDIFSAGCVIAEVFLDGEALFDLPTLLDYRVGTFDPEPAIAKITDPRVRDLVRHMTQRDPMDRCLAAHYLRTHESEHGIFPPYFPFLFSFMADMVLPQLATPDLRVAHVCRHYATILQETAGVQDPAGAAYFDHLCVLNGLVAAPGEVAWGDAAGWEWGWEWQPGLPPANTAVGDGGMFAALYKPWAMVAAEEGEAAAAAPTPHPGGGGAATQPAPRPPGGGLALDAVLADVEAALEALRDGKGPLPAGHVGHPAPTPPAPAVVLSGDDVDTGGFAIVIGLLTSCVRHVTTPTRRLMAIALLARLACHTDDETRLQRVVPYLVSLLGDKAAVVRAHAVCALTQLLCQVSHFPPSDAQLFPQYIIPAVAKFPTDPEAAVQLAFANCLPLIAQCTRRFMDVAHWKRHVDVLVKATRDARAGADAGDGTPAAGAGAPVAPAAPREPAPPAAIVLPNHDHNLETLHDRVRTVLQKWVVQLTVSSSAAMAHMEDILSSGSVSRRQAEAAVASLACLPASADFGFVKRALLGDLTRLCVFFGRDVTEGFLLPLFFTFLNDRDWKLKEAFFRQVVGVAAYVGRNNTRLVVPLLETALQTPHDVVAHRALVTLGHLADLDLLPTPVLLQLLTGHVGLACHPDAWVRDGTFTMVVCALLAVGWPDAMVLVGPILADVLVDAMGDGGAADRLWAAVASAAGGAAVGPPPAALGIPADLMAVLVPEDDDDPLLPEAGGARQPPPPPPGTAPAPTRPDPAAARRCIRAALEAAVLPPLPRRVYDQALAACLDSMLKPGGGPTSGGEDDSSLLSSDDAWLSEAAAGGGEGDADGTAARHRSQLRQLRSHIKAVAPHYRYTLMEQVRLRERVAAGRRSRQPHPALPSHAPRPLPYSADALSALPVRSVSVPDQRYTTLHPTPPATVLPATVELEVGGQGGRHPVAATPPLPGGMRAPAVRAPEPPAVADLTGERLKRRHWTVEAAAQLRRHGRRARRLFLRHGVWDPNLPMQADGSSGTSAFFYPDAAQEDATLASSGDEAPPAATGAGAAAADDDAAVVLSTKLPQTPVQVATQYSSAVSAAVQSSAGGAGAWADAPAAAGLSVNARVRVHSAHRRRSRGPSAGADGGRALQSSAARLRLTVGVDASHVADTLPASKSLHTGVDTLYPHADGDDDDDDSGEEGKEDVAPPAQKPQPQAPVDALPSRKLASVRRAMKALDVPPLPPALGYLQRATQGRGPVCAHALRTASGIPGDSDADSDSDPDVGPEVAAVTATWPPARDLPAPSALALLSPAYGSMPAAPPPPAAGASAASAAGGGTPLSPPPVTGGGVISSGGGGGGEPALPAAVVPPPDVGDGSGYTGSGPASFLSAERGWGNGGVVSASGGAATGGEASDDGSWGSRPRGLLLATCRAHTAPVTALAVCQDHSFFASAGEDGKAVVWPTRGIDKDVAARPMAAHTVQGGRLTSMTVVDNTTSVASASTNGTVHVWKVDMGGGGGSSGGGASVAPLPAPATVARLSFPDEGAVQAVRHFNDALHSVLVCATQRWGVHGVDLRARRVAWRRHLPPELGLVTAMELAPGNHAVVVGTNRGVVAVYDLRFQVLAAVWRHSARAPVAAVFPYTRHVAGGGKHLAAVVACGEEEASVFDLETGAPVRVLRCLPDAVSEVAARRPPHLTRIPTRGNALAAPGDGVDALVAALEEVDVLPAPSGAMQCLLCPLPTNTADAASGVGFVLGGIRGTGVPRRPWASTDVVSASEAPREAPPPPDTDGLPAWLLSGGADGCVRCWDLDRPRSSHTVLGMDPGHTRHVYDVLQGSPYPPPPPPGVSIWDEWEAVQAAHTGSGPSVLPAAADVPTGVRAASVAASGPGALRFLSWGAADGMGLHARAEHRCHPPPTMLLSQQPVSPLDNPAVMPGASAASSSPMQQLKGPTPAPTRHENDVMAMAWLDIPARLLVTGGRDGVVKVWR